VIPCKPENTPKAIAKQMEVHLSTEYQFLNSNEQHGAVVSAPQQGNRIDEAAGM